LHWELLVCSDGFGFCEQCLVDGLDWPDARVSFLNSGVGEALERAQGRYIVVLGSDVLLEPQTLFRVAQTFTTTSARLLYGDAVLIDPEGDTVVGFDCRPAFSPELLRCHPYVDDMLSFDCGCLEGYEPPADSTCRLVIHDMLLQAYVSGTRVAHIAEFIC
ncbi:hypothetical protein JZU71_04090, partial [bacterium]|nr:hypothetical protein [bacterium]